MDVIKKPSNWGNFSTFSTWITRPITRCGARATPLLVHRTLLWQLLRNGNLHGSGMSHATTASLKPSFRAPWRVGDTVVGRGNVWQTTSKSGHLWPCTCQSCSQGPSVEKNWGGSLLNRSSCPLTSKSVKGHNWAQLLVSVKSITDEDIFCWKRLYTLYPVLSSIGDYVFLKQIYMTNLGSF